MQQHELFEQLTCCSLLLMLTEAAVRGSVLRPLAAASVLEHRALHIGGVSTVPRAAASACSHHVIQEARRRLSAAPFGEANSVMAPQRVRASQTRMS